MSVTGTADSDSPIRAGVSILDLGTGVWMALGILAALLEKQRSGRGQRVDASLFQTGTMLMCYHLLYRQFAGVNPKPQGSRHTAFALYGAFQTGDGPLMLGISSDKAFQRLCIALGHPEWATDTRFATNTQRVRNADALEDGISAVLRTYSRAHWSEVLDCCDIANDPVQTPEQMLVDRQVAALEQLVEVGLGNEEPVLLPRLPLGLSLTPPAIQGPPPQLGHHTLEVLREAGYSTREIEDLIRNQVCDQGS